LLDIYLNILINDVFNNLFVFLDSKGNLKEEDVLSKMHIRRVLTGLYGIASYAGSHAVRTPDSLYYYYQTLLGQKKNSLVKQAYLDLEKELPGTFKDYFKDERFDTKVIPGLVKNALSPKNIVTMLMENDENFRTLALSFAKTLGVENPSLGFLNQTQKQQILFDVLRYFGYCVKK
jgi:hypothetical protein